MGSNKLLTTGYKSDITKFFISVFGAVVKPPPDLTYRISTIRFPGATYLITT